MNRELGQTFQAFVLEGRTPIPFKTPLEDVQRALGTSTTYTIDQNYGTYAVYADGVELLFDNGRQCLVQYEIARLGQVQLGADLITPDTSYEKFKGYVTQQDWCIQRPSMMDRLSGLRRKGSSFILKRIGSSPLYNHT